MKFFVGHTWAKLAHAVEYVGPREQSVSWLRCWQLGCVWPRLPEPIPPHVGDIRGGRLEGLLAGEIAIDNGAKLLNERIHVNAHVGAA